MRDMFGKSNIFLVGGDTSAGDPPASAKIFDLDFFSGVDTVNPLNLGLTTFKFGRMFRMPNLPEFRPAPEGLIDLGIQMSAGVDTDDNTEVPAGYTYLGQFIDHDVTFDKTRGFPNEELTIEDVVQGRSPSLDLDSLYGLDPDREMNLLEGRKIYQPDGVKLRVGMTDMDFSLDFWENFDNDLPRGDDPKKVETASIADERNDENLAVAQTHLAFIKFHNKVVDLIRASPSTVGLNNDEIFQEARRDVVRHYQWIILHDFLPRIIERDVLKDVLDNGCLHFRPKPGHEFMPFEFSVAAFRFGHSLVRETYEWNKFFHAKPPTSGPGGVADLSELFRRTGSRGQILGGGHRHLPSTWIINWLNFFDFNGFPGHGKNPNLNFTKLIDPTLSPTLAQIRFHAQMSTRLSDLLAQRGLANSVVSLAVQNLLRSWLVGVPTAQSIVERINDSLPSEDRIKPLTADEIAADHGTTLRQSGMHKLTPLWYYILIEAKTVHEGLRLGPVGSRIVAETFVGLIKASNTSILRKENPTDPDWRPHLGPVQPERFNMSDLLFFVNDLNPLGS
jgi:hypothetical protein